MGLSISTGRANGMIGRVVFSVFGLAFALMGSFFVKQAWKSMHETKAMQAWSQTTGTIVSSKVEDDGEDFRLAISYHYEVGGHPYEGGRYGQQRYLTEETLGKIEQVHRQFPEGKTVDVHYNPANPTDAVLELPTVNSARRSFGFTFLFPAIGLLFASLPWLGGRGGKHKPATTLMTSGSSKTPLIIFGLIFALVGLAILKPILITPLQKTRDAQQWNSVQATVASSKVKSHDSDDGTTYSVYIAYRYEVDGHLYIGDNYTFMGGSSSGYDSKAAIVRQYPEGREINVYVNPADPSDSVILRDYSPALLFGLIPLAFVFAGIAIIVAGIRNKQAKLDQTQSTEQIVSLKAPAPAKKAIGIVLFAGIWNGIVYFLCHSDAPLMFPIVFGFFGIVMLGAAIHAILATFNPRPTVEITPGNIHPGTSVAMRWRLSGRTDRIRTLSIKLQCLKITTETHRSGGKTQTRIVKKPLHEEELRHAESPSEIAQGTLQFTIPAEQPASCPGNTAGIQWLVVFEGVIARWPDLKCEMPFTVYPQG